MIPEFSGGKDSVRTKLNAMVAELNRLMALVGDEDIMEVNRSASGATVSLSRDRLHKAMSLTAPHTWLVKGAYLTDGGGGKYRGVILRGRSSNQPTDDVSMPEGLEDGPEVYLINPEEDGCTGHLLQIPFYGTAIRIGYNDMENSDDPDPLPLFMLTSVFQRGYYPVTVVITGNADGGGKYLGKILTGASTGTGTDDLNLPEGMVEPEEDDALIFNLYENGSNGHELDVGSYHNGIVVGVSDDSSTSNFKIIHIQSLKTEVCIEPS
jgi:hypothetical protein